MARPERGVRDLLTGPSPLDQATFLEVYDRMRIVAYVSAIGLAITLGGWAISVLVPISIVAIALLGMAHAALRPKSVWIEKSMVDITFLVVMATATDIGEVLIIVVMAHVMAGWMFMPPRQALTLTSYGSILGVVGVAVTGYLDIAPELLLRRVVVIGSVLVVTVAIVTWLMLTTGREVRRQRLQNEELLEEKDRLLADKNRLIASVSHELRTPLTGVVGLASELAGHSAALSAGEIEELAQMIADSSSELATLVDDLLVAARLESGSLSVASTPIVLEEAVGDLLTGHAVELRELVVLGDEVRIRQIVRNLLSNAERYGGDTVEVRVQEGAGTTSIVIADNGDGVPAESIERIFEPFGRAHTRPGLTDAVGLGLAISRQLAELMGGALRYDRRGGWTSFELILQAPTRRRTVPQQPIPVS